MRERAIKRIFPVALRRCHDCNWRKAGLVHGSAEFSSYLLSLIGYAATVALGVGVIVGFFALMLSMLGVPMPW